MFEKHLKKTTNGYVYVAKRCWIQNVQGVYIFNFALPPVGRQGMADIFSILRLLLLAARICKSYANCRKIHQYNSTLDKEDVSSKQI
jgi:hypothetical protein